MSAWLTLCEGIAREEGWLNPLSRCRRNNNPGNLNFALWEGQSQFGAVLEPLSQQTPKPRFAKFPTAQLGFNAMSFLLKRDYVGLTLTAFVMRWAPSTDENNTALYTHNLSMWTGFAPDDVLTEEMLNAPILETT